MTADDIKKKLEEEYGLSGILICNYDDSTERFDMDILVDFDYEIRNNDRFRQCLKEQQKFEFDHFVYTFMEDGLTLPEMEFFIKGNVITTSYDVKDEAPDVVLKRYFTDFMNEEIFPFIFGK